MSPNFLRNHHIGSHRSCTILHSHHQWRNVPFTPPPLQHKLSSVFLILAILTGVRWNLRVVLICISLKTKDVECFLKCLSTILDSSVESSLVRSALHFFYWIICSFDDQFLEFCVYLEISPLSDVGLVKIFSHSVGCRFVLLTMSFALQKLFSFRRYHLLIVLKSFFSLYDVGVPSVCCDTINE